LKCRTDAEGALKVGPASTGADPGPICYGKRTEMKVTDANLCLGRLVPEHFLGGAPRLRTGGLQAPLGKMTAALGRAGPGGAEPGDEHGADPGHAGEVLGAPAGGGPGAP
jgi:N-methylhydantoinase A/oxoprolinase/acetone carboxylase beta subunit